ncbi:MAG: LLM class flavin-dependent oxidoreductase [Actinomycetota bacterium]
MHALLNDKVPTFGLWYDFRQRPPLEDYARFYAECLEEIEEAERLGYSGVWLSEHHFVDDGYLPSPLVVAAAIAARTSRIVVGTNVLLLPLHHPLRVAEDAAVTSLVSGGRFVLGVGQGYVRHEFEALGSERRYRPSLLEEGIEIIRRAWTEGRTGYEGRRWRLPDLPFEPRPAGETPIYVGAFAGPAIDRAARLGDGFLASAGGGEFAATYRKAMEARARHAREGKFPFVASGVVHISESTERAREEVGSAIVYQRNRYAEWGTDPGKERPKPLEPGDLPWERYFVGTPEEVADGLIRLYREAPYDHLCFWGRLPGITHERALENARLFATEVAPRVRAAVGG